MQQPCFFTESALAMQNLFDELDVACGQFSHADQIAEEAIDPVCGTAVAIRTAIYEYEYQDCRYYFCSACCQFAFCSDPAEYTPTSGNAHNGG